MTEPEIYDFSPDDVIDPEDLAWEEQIYAEIAQDRDREYD